ncbi:MAG: ATP-binding cassette domain-containing protein, partial [Hyphomicrobiales bacterium]
IRSLCHKATILRGGKVVGSCDPTLESAKSLAEMMIGTNLSSPEREAVAPGPVRLAIKGLSLASEEQFGVDLADIDLEVRGGEIVGIAGVAGNGQVELMDALIGESLAPADTAIAIDGKAVGRSGPTKRRALGMAFVPEERLGHGAVPEMALWENAVLTGRSRMHLVDNGLISASKARTFAERVVAEFGVRTAGVGHAARSLSGGNLQKFVVGREILQQPSVLIASQPTWGVDAGAAAAIHKALLALAKAGAAILVISQDLDELFAISSRIAVIANGHLTAARPVEELTIETIGLSMGGTHTEHRGAETAHA